MKKLILLLVFLLFLPVGVLAASPSTVTYDTHGAASVPSQSAYDSFKTNHEYAYYYINSSNYMYLVGANAPITVTYSSEGHPIYSTSDGSALTRLGYNDILAGGQVSPYKPMSAVPLSMGEQWTYYVDTEKPVITSSLAAGTYSESQQVTLTSNEPATIYYTLDGTMPGESSTVYQNPILIDKTTTLKYFGKDAAGNKSDVVSQTFAIEIPSDRDGDGVPDSSDLYPDDPTNTPPASDESSEADKKTHSVLIMILGVALTALVLGGKGIL